MSNNFTGHQRNISYQWTSVAMTFRAQNKTDSKCADDKQQQQLPQRVQGNPNNNNITKTHAATTTDSTTAILMKANMGNLPASSSATTAAAAAAAAATTSAAAATTMQTSLVLMWLLASILTAQHCSEAASITAGDSLQSNTVAAGSNKAPPTDNTAPPNVTGWRLISRADWHASPPKMVRNFALPAPYVILHHSYQPDVCRTPAACEAAMRSMQRYHVEHQHWLDIGYSFAVGGDCNVYEARGYGVIGAHAPNYNSRSIGLLLIGNFEAEMPPACMLEVAQSFLNYSVALGTLTADYILYGHRQVRDTACPGDQLYEEIKRWPHWQQLQ